MILKPGINPLGLRAELILAIIVADSVYTRYKQELVITSLNDGVHSETSLHYNGLAFDCRTFYFKKGEAAKVTKDIQERLTKDYDVILEKDHIHIEYQPKRRRM